MQVLQQLHAITVEVMGKAVDNSAPLMAAGLDSMAAVELKNAVSSKFGVSLPATLAFDYPTLDALSKFITASLESSSGPSSGMQASHTHANESHPQAHQQLSNCFTMSVLPHIVSAKSWVYLILHTRGVRHSKLKIATFCSNKEESRCNTLARACYEPGANPA